MPDWIAKYAKGHTALIGAVVTWLIASLADGSISGAEWLALVTAVLTPASVAAVRNRNTDRLKPSVKDVIE